MRKTAYMLGVISILVGSGLGPARATSITLGAVNVITADHPASVWVHVPVPAEVDTWSAEEVAISTSGGRFAGISMSDARGSNGVHLVSLDFAYCTAPGCSSPYQPDRIGGLFDPDDEQGFTTTLPAGDYLLQVITDGAPVTVTMHLHGLSGATSLVPSGASDLDVKTLEEKFSAGQAPLKPVWTAGGTGRLGTAGGMIAANMWFIGSAHAVSAFGNCVTEGEPAVYAPECPTSTVSSGFTALVPGLDYGWGMYGFTTIWGGDWTAETWYTAVATVEEAHANALWISF